MRRFSPGPPPPEYLDDYPPPPQGYRRDRLPPPSDFQSDYPPPPPEYRRDCPPPPPEYQRDHRPDYPPPPPPPRDHYGERYHQDPPPPWDDPRRDYRDAPPPLRGYYRQPPPPREYDEAHAEEWNSYGRRHGSTGSQQPPSLRGGGHPHPRGVSHGPVLRGRGRGGTDQVHGRGRGRGDHSVTLPPKLKVKVETEKNNTTSQNGPSSTPCVKQSQTASNQTSTTSTNASGLLKSALKKPTLHQPVSQEPGVQNSALEQPCLQNSGLQNTALQKPALQKPALPKQEPGLQKPALPKQEPGLQKPALPKQEPGLQNPGLQKPGLQQPGLQKPGLQQPGLQQSGLQKHGLQQPGLQQPGLQQPGLQKPGLQKPGLQQPGLQQPGLQKPGLQQPGLQQPGLQQPGLQQPGLQQPGLQQPGLQQPGLQQPGLQQAGLQQAGSQQAGLQNPGLQNPGFNTGTRYFMAAKPMQGQGQKSNTANGNRSVKAAVPDDANFISFKNSLQEYCQKTHLPVPCYTTFKNSYGYSSRVNVSRQSFKSSGIHKDRKEADQNAAFMALRTLGLIQPSVDFKTKTVVSGVKRPNSVSNKQVTPVAKKVKKMEPNASVAYKSKLNEFCQKFHLPAPQYETVRNSSKGFMTTMVYNGKVFQSTALQITKKLAEENAAQLVLSKLNQATPPEPSLQNVIQTCMQISSGSATSAAVSTSTTPSEEESIADMIQTQQPFVVSYKNQLQEYCHKQKIDHPVYESFIALGLYACKVTVEGRIFTSSNCKTKKGSEQSAARLALQVLGPVPPAPI